MTSKTLFIIYYDLGLGGVQRKIVDIVKYLNNKNKYKNLKAYIILDSQRKYDLKEDLFLQEVRNTKVKILQKPQINFRKIKFPLSFYVFWKTLILKPDIILGFMRRFSIIAIIMKYVFWFRKIKVVVSFDNVPSLYLPIDIKKPYKLNLWSWLIKRLYPKADSVIVPSDAAKSDLVKRYQVPSNMVKVNKNWVSEYGYAEKFKSVYDLIYIGRVDPVKNIDKFVDTVLRLRKNKPKIRACIVGWGDDAEKIRQLIKVKKLTSVIDMVGTKLDKKKYLLKSKIYLLPTSFEGLPIAALEAMAYGVPVISNNYPGAKEFIEHGKNGYLSGNVKELVYYSNLLLENHNKRILMGANARKYVKKNHGIDELKDFISILDL